MSSGIAVTDEVVSTFNEIKMGHKHKYAIFRINDALTEVVVESTSNDGNWDNFTAQLPAQGCRYVVYDLSFTSDDGGERSKILFIVWAPDSAKIKEKMLITSTKDNVKKKFVGIGKEIQATDMSEVALEEVTAQVLSTAR
mmetsp:Transcript_12913/g.19863  ORF Transcript_12913/g.19863 Transcript_12913/m.19863 type:complete len:140 (-) Transcript_12913:70-489(-)|eukprot:CAMPEP_0201507586 /NCGR_PEP_ID=MMETSP0161_2-20130828/1223_1 /ASSEMBLY_ACC=CAM_ASM_000251 /TAXON_ID=180227 /ORGANISM="Neoparamoeba aestuarina, Strain SoJaBio B1-5/56/2" /LENGTH=139 /DNA_ID=CAMNT_0047902005 /DNA_START=55 /DNA_END=474 /DNA_ORIENTATION=+